MASPPLRNALGDLVRKYRAVKWIFIGIFLSALALVAFPFITFKDHRVSNGSAYGFTVGESAVQTHERAWKQLQSGRVEAFELGEGSGAFPYFGDNIAKATTIEHWQLVVDKDWWNNTIYLSFNDGKLIEIWRFRVCCEVP